MDCRVAVRTVGVAVGRLEGWQRAEGRACAWDRAASGRGRGTAARRVVGRACVWVRGVASGWACVWDCGAAAVGRAYSPEPALTRAVSWTARRVGVRGGPRCGEWFGSERAYGAAVWRVLARACGTAARRLVGRAHGPEPVLTRAVSWTARRVGVRGGPRCGEWFGGERAYGAAVWRVLARACGTAARRLVGRAGGAARRVGVGGGPRRGEWLGERAGPGVARGVRGVCGALVGGWSGARVGRGWGVR